MTTRPRDVPDHLRSASARLPSIQGFECLEEWKLFESRGVWALRFTIDIGAAGNALVPPVTEWFVSVTERYPIGRIQVLPSRDRGLTGTFHHQRLNRSLSDAPWTGGTICVDVPGYLLKRLLPTPEPSSTTERLTWHVERAKAWLRAAADRDLVRPGERFELPDFPCDNGATQRFAFLEGSDSITRWQSIRAKTGLVKLVPVPGEKRHRLVPAAFFDSKGQALVDVSWGNFIRLAAKDYIMGGWVMLHKVPILSPWQAPITWGDLCRISNDQGMNLPVVLTGVLGHLRDGKEHMLLVGFPIPELVDGAPSRIYWQALALPRLATLNEPGFRPGMEGAMRRDLGTVLTQDKTLKWIKSDNWDSASLTSRGRLSVADASVVVIGVGALGSAVAELLIRGGVEKMVLVDGDDLEPGNLVRHTLTLADEGKNKASAVAERLNGLSPHANVETVPKFLDSQDTKARAAIEQADLVIDCTASDDVLRQLHEFNWKESAGLVSLAIGLNAQRIYVHTSPGWSFSFNDFKQLVDPLIQEDYSAHPDFKLPQESTGCWHPVFPARAHEIWLLAALAVKELEDLVRTNPGHAELRLIRLDGGLRREVVLLHGQ